MSQTSVVTRSQYEPIQWDFCFICQNKTFKKDFKVHKITSGERVNRLMECALSQDDDRLVRVLNCDDFIISIDLTRLSLPTISHTNHRFCIGTLTYNALLPVQRFFSPFWTRMRKFQRTTERCHHTEYERVCPVKFWYYNNLITNQQNTLIIDKNNAK
jgi:hypothetical protein